MVLRNLSFYTGLRQQIQNMGQIIALVDIQIVLCNLEHQLVLRTLSLFLPRTGARPFFVKSGTACANFVRARSAQLGADFPPPPLDLARALDIGELPMGVGGMGCKSVCGFVKHQKSSNL